MTTVYIKLKTQDGTLYQTEPQEANTEELELLENYINQATMGKADNITLDTTEGKVFFPKDVIATSIITIIKS